MGTAPSRNCRSARGLSCGRVDDVEASRCGRACGGSVCGGSLGQARALGGRARRRRGPADRIERRAARAATPPRRHREDGAAGDARRRDGVRAPPRPPRRRARLGTTRKASGTAATPETRPTASAAAPGAAPVVLRRPARDFTGRARNRPRRGPNPLEISKKNTPDLVSWTRRRRRP